MWISLSDYKQRLELFISFIRGVKLAQSSSSKSLKLECADILESLKVLSLFTKFLGVFSR